MQSADPIPTLLLTLVDNTSTNTEMEISLGPCLWFGGYKYEGCMRIRLMWSFRGAFLLVSHELHGFSFSTSIHQHSVVILIVGIFIYFLFILRLCPPNQDGPRLRHNCHDYALVSHVCAHTCSCTHMNTLHEEAQEENKGAHSLHNLEIFSLTMIQK
jgi:hypothetical protein